ncbi:Rhodanese-like domain-containing protein 17 [Vitis vinifera]|uniref:Rhodanese-like domain-containing protein 17 n=1 Tax=Vitis vinifera TaxID=29760 RepID=A0A438EUV8_VITVI|nr:Rhodanese-like domain-containing protein 17 [Vitis vinifera]
MASPSVVLVEPYFFYIAANFYIFTWCSLGCCPSLVSVSFLCLLLCCSSATEVVTIDVHAAKELTNSGYRYLDVRTVEEFKKGHADVENI